MEKGSFQAPFSEISNLEIRDEELPATPNEVPHERAHSYTSSRSRSSTVEALLSQNEDLMSRLKVTLLRLTKTEDENEILRRQHSQVYSENEAISDQLLVWKEKENFWQQKNAKLESEIQTIRARFPEFESLQERLERYMKYHDKIRTHVKPYIQQLKAYAQSLVAEIRKLNAEIETKEMRLQNLEQRLHFMSEGVQTEVRKQEEKTQKLVRLFEQEKETWQLQAEEIHSMNVSLAEKAAQLEPALLRQDGLENTIIALKRTHQNVESELRQKLEIQSQEMQQLKTNHIEKQCYLDSLEKKSSFSLEEANRLRERADQLESQLASLRYMWNSKCEESDRQTATLRSLERLNQELSHRLNQARKGESSL